MRAFVAAAIVAIASAVKQGTTQQYAKEDDHEYWRNKYDLDFRIHDYEQANSQVDNWFNNNARPFFNEHRAEVMRVAYA